MQGPEGWNGREGACRLQAERCACTPKWALLSDTHVSEETDEWLGKKQSFFIPCAGEEMVFSGAGP